MGINPDESDCKKTLKKDNHSQILTIPNVKSGSGYDSIVIN